MAAFTPKRPPVTGATMSTNTKTGKGQNRPASGGKSGSGKARGQAPFKSAAAPTLDSTQPGTTSRDRYNAQPGAMSLSAGQDKFAKQQRGKGR